MQCSHRLDVKALPRARNLAETAAKQYQGQRNGSAGYRHLEIMLTTGMQGDTMSRTNFDQSEQYVMQLVSGWIIKPDSRIAGNTGQAAASFFVQVQYRKGAVCGVILPGGERWLQTVGIW
jgi:hypothetical protein